MEKELQKLSARAKERYIKAGKKFGSELVVKQGNQTLNALVVHGVVLALHGFSAKDAERLGWGVKQLEEALANRGEEQGRRKGMSKIEMRQVRDGKLAAKQGASVLGGVIAALRDEDGADAERLQLELEVERTQIKRDAKNADRVPATLRHLHKVLSNPKVATWADERGGEALKATLLEQADRLDTLQKDRALRPGTSEHTEHMDLLDGIVLDLVRRASQSAKSAAKSKGQASIERAFILDQIYTHRDDSDATDATSN